MAGHEHDRQVDTQLGELVLEIEAVDARQADIEYQAAGPIGPAAV